MSDTSQPTSSGKETTGSQEPVTLQEAIALEAPKSPTKRSRADSCDSVQTPSKTSRLVDNDGSQDATKCAAKSPLDVNEPEQPSPCSESSVPSSHARLLMAQDDPPSPSEPYVPPERAETPPPTGPHCDGDISYFPGVEDRHPGISTGQNLIWRWSELISYWMCRPSLPILFDQPLRDLDGHIGNFTTSFQAPFSAELANSQAARIFQPVCSRYSEFLQGPGARFVIRAGIWHYVIDEFFNKPSSLWAGAAGYHLEQCFSDIPDLPRNPHDARCWQRSAYIRDVRARFAHILTKEFHEKTEIRKEKPDYGLEELQEKVLSVFRPFLAIEETYGKVNYCDKEVIRLLESIGELKWLMNRSCVVFKLEMIADLSPNDLGYDFAFDEKTMVLDDYGVEPDEQNVDRIAFVLSPMLTCRGHMRSSDHRLVNLEDRVIEWKARVVPCSWVDPCFEPEKDEVVVV